MSVGKEKRRSPSTGDNGKYSGVAMGGTLHCHWPEVSFGNASLLTLEPVYIPAWRMMPQVHSDIHYARKESWSSEIHTWHGMSPGNHINTHEFQMWHFRSYFQVLCPACTNTWSDWDSEPGSHRARSVTGYPSQSAGQGKQGSHPARECSPQMATEQQLLCSPERWNRWFNSILKAEETKPKISTPSLWQRQ